VSGSCRSGGGRGARGTVGRSRCIRDLLAAEQVFQSRVLGLLTVLKDADGQLLQIALEDLALADDLLGGREAILLKILLPSQENVPNEQEQDQAAEPDQDEKLNSIHDIIKTGGDV
jgi:hypothetical protein